MWPTNERNHVQALPSRCVVERHLIEEADRLGSFRCKWCTEACETGLDRLQPGYLRCSNRPPDARKICEQKCSRTRWETDKHVYGRLPPIQRVRHGLRVS